MKLVSTCEEGSWKSKKTESGRKNRMISKSYKAKGSNWSKKPSSKEKKTLQKRICKGYKKSKSEKHNRKIDMLLIFKENKSKMSEN